MHTRIARILGMFAVTGVLLWLTACRGAVWRADADTDIWRESGNAHWAIEQRPGEATAGGYRTTYALRCAWRDATSCAPIAAIAAGRVRAIAPDATDERGRQTVCIEIEHAANYAVRARQGAYDAHDVGAIVVALRGVMPPVERDDLSESHIQCPPSFTNLRVGDEVLAGQHIAYACAIDGVAEAEMWIGEGDAAFDVAGSREAAFATGALLIEDVGRAERTCACASGLDARETASSALWEQASGGARGYMRFGGCYCVEGALTTGAAWRGAVSVTIPAGFRVVVYERAHYEGERLVLLPGTTRLEGRWARPQSAVMLYEHEPVDTRPTCDTCQTCGDAAR